MPNAFHLRDTWMQQILPFIEQAPTYNKYMSWKGGGRGGGFGFTTLEPPNTSLPDEVWSCKSETFPNLPCSSQGNYNSPRNFARSYHTGGVHVALADASTRFVSWNIDRTLFQNLGTRRGNEVVGEW